MIAVDDRRKAEFKKQLSDAEKLHSIMCSRWRTLDEVYHANKEFPKHQQDLLRSRLRVKWAWQQIETILPRIMDPDPRFAIMPVESGDSDMSDSLNVLLRYQLNKDRFIAKQRSWAEDGTVRALGVAKVVWLQKKQTMRIRRKLDPETVREFESIGEEIPDDLLYEKKENVIVENRPTVIYVDPFDFLWDPKATCDSDWEYVFHRSWLSLETLKARERAGTYQNVSQIENASESDGGPRSAYESSEEANARRTGLYPVYERWHVDGTIMVMCGDVVLRDGPSPYYHGDIPFAVFRSQPTPRSLVGVSEVESIDHLQEAIWTRENQRIDAASLALNQILILDPTIQGVRQLAIRPGLKIYANAAQRVDQLRLDSLQNIGFNETEAYLGAMQQMTGASPYLAGSDPSMSGVDQSTATGASIMQEEGNKRMYLKKLEFQLFESRIAKLMIQLNHQYLSASEIERILGDNASGYRYVSPEEIPMFLDVIPQGMSDSMSKGTDMQRVIEILNTAKDLHLAPMGDGTIFTIKPFIERAIKIQGFDSRMAFEIQPPAPEGAVGEQGSVV